MNNNSELYLDLLKKSLINWHYGEFEYEDQVYGFFKSKLSKVLKLFNLKLIKMTPMNKDKRIIGNDWPQFAYTMIGLDRLNNIQYCVNKILNDNISGDFIEAGVWRGGATIFMRGLLKINNINDRKVWVADSFEGFIKPDHINYPMDKNDKFANWKGWAVSIEDVKNNFNKYDLLDNNVIFLKGQFKGTLNNKDINKLALIRLDGDRYESTMDGLKYLYPKLQIGGFIIIDDYTYFKACKQAVIDYRIDKKINDEIHIINSIGSIYWRKSQ